MKYIFKTHLLALGDSQPPKPNPLLSIQITRFPKHTLDSSCPTNQLINGHLSNHLGAMFLLECGQLGLFGGNLGGQCFLEGGYRANAGGGEYLAAGGGVAGEEFGGGGEGVHGCYWWCCLISMHYCAF